MAGDDTEKLIEELHEAATPGKTGILPRRALYAEAAAALCAQRQEIEKLREGLKPFAVDGCSEAYEAQYGCFDTLSAVVGGARHWITEDDFRRARSALANP